MENESSKQFLKYVVKRIIILEKKPLLFKIKLIEKYRSKVGLLDCSFIDMGFVFYSY